jgi:hypothetical protein
MSLNLEIPKPADVIKGELAENGDWVVASVSTNISWPVTAQKVRYRGFDVWVIPIMEGFHSSVAVKRPNELSRKDAEILLSRFLSSIAWVESGGVIVEFITGGNLPRPMGSQKKFGYSIRECFEFDYLPEPTDEKAMLALALMREGRAINHPAYSFLSLYRAFEVCVLGKDRGEWISDNIPNITSHLGKEAVGKLQAKGIKEIGDHLRETCRSAIAHANSNPIINPDHPEDGRMLQETSPIMDALAELAIEQKLHVQTLHSVFRDHLYELAGFKRIMGSEVVEAIIAGTLTSDAAVDLPVVDVRIRGKDSYAPLESLTPVEAFISNSTLYMSIRSTDGMWLLKLALHFAEERLRFDIFNGIYATKNDDDSPEYADGAAELQRFFRDYFGNGALMIYDSETGELLSRCDPFIPLNMMADHKGSNAIIEEWKRKAAERRDKARRDNS